MTGKTASTVLNRDSLVSYLKEQIISGHFAEGSKLPSERTIAEEYGLSRPAVREALRDLAGRGLIETVPGRGAYARRPQAGDLAGPLEAFYRRQRITPRHLVEARKMIECEAASLAASRSGRKDLEARELTLARFDHSADLIDRTQYDIAFHMSIVRAAHNPVIETMCGSIRASLPSSCCALWGTLPSLVRVCRTTGRLARPSATGTENVPVLPCPVI